MVQYEFFHEHIHRRILLLIIINYSMYEWKFFEYMIQQQCIHYTLLDFSKVKRMTKNREIFLSAFGKFGSWEGIFFKYFCLFNHCFITHLSTYKSQFYNLNFYVVCCMLCLLRFLIR